MVDFERIAAKPASVGEAPACGHAREVPASRNAADAFAELDRRAVEQQPVDQAGGEERLGHRRAAFDEQVLHVGETADVLGVGQRLPARRRFAAGQHQRGAGCAPRAPAGARRAAGASVRSVPPPTRIASRARVRDGRARAPPRR